jgi:uncharacterized protein YprB with RNaseH-like and TPR domain
MDLKSRLRSIYGSGDDESSDLRERLERIHRHEAFTIAEHLDGYWKETPSGKLVRIERTYPRFYCHGDHSFDELSQISGEAVALLGGNPALSEFTPRSTLFLDTETTGLAGGAGTYPFLIGAGYFESDCFRLIQFFLPDFESEHAFLSDFSDFVETCGFRYLVTFNGKTFDLSLLENRFVLQRLENPCEPLLHLDLLHPCRLLWRGRFEDCCLQTLERHVLNYSRFPDVPSALIPVCYFNFLHWGEFGTLREVLEHNRKDVISMAVLLGIAAQSVDLTDIAPSVDSLSLARFHFRRGRLSHAAGFLEKSLEDERCSPNRAEALFNLARLRRRLGDDDAALDVCFALIRHDSMPPVGAFEEAAKILEHKKRAFQDALDVITQALLLYPGSAQLERRRLRLVCRVEGKKWY